MRLLVFVALCLGLAIAGPCSTQSYYCTAPPGQEIFTLTASDLAQGCLNNLLPCPALSWPAVVVQPDVTDADLALFPSSITEISGTLVLDNSANAQTFLTTLAGFAGVTVLGGLYLVR